MLVKNPAKRRPWIDFGRGISMFLVFLYHSEVYYSDHHSWSWLFEPVFLTGFFFLSGYLFTSDIRKVDFSRKFKQVLRAILIPYFIFMFLFFLPKLIFLKQEALQNLYDIFTLRASWFVVTIAGLQLIYALLLYIRPTVKMLIIATVIMAFAGYGVLQITRERLPFCLSNILNAVPYFCLGILYRRYETSFAKWASVKYLVFFALIFFGAVIIDHIYLQSEMCMAVNIYRNQLLEFCYAVLGITTLVLFCKIVPAWRLVNYIGANSLTFYFLNGLSLRTVILFAHKLTLLEGGGYAGVFIVAVCACLITFPMVWGINKYLPFVTGKKESFNTLSRKLHWDINW